jgi:hypothetical protein
MANGTLKVQNIQTSSGSGTITLGQSGETIAFGSGVTSKMNQPAFEAYLSANQSSTDNTYIKMQIDTELYDTDSCYDNTTNYRFTPTVAGKYFVYCQGRTDAGTNNTGAATTGIFKNGSQIAHGTFQKFNTAVVEDYTAYEGHVVDMNGTTDYVEAFSFCNDTSGDPTIIGDSTRKFTFFGAYRIGVE